MKLKEKMIKIVKITTEETTEETKEETTEGTKEGEKTEETTEGMIEIAEEKTVESMMREADEDQRRADTMMKKIDELIK